ncbi:MAG: hypothetical protein HDR86_00820 [Bacteroides sp.]|nr:hypothetical protein [Bacteroides sp.]
MTKKKYNDIFSQLVGDENDVVGHIAYCIYKREKVQYVLNFKKEKARDPYNTELELYHSACRQRVEGYRVQASQILGEFMEAAIGQTIKRVERDCRMRHAEMLQSIVDPLIPPKGVKPYMNGVSQSIVGSFLFSLIAATIIFMAVYKGFDIPIYFGTPTEVVHNETANKIPTYNPQQQ